MSRGTPPSVLKAISIFVIAATASAGLFAQQSGVASCSSIGEQKTAVILASFPSNPLPSQVTTALIRDAVFGPVRSVNTYWQETSYGKTFASGDVFGPVVLDDALNSCSKQGDIIRPAMVAVGGDFSRYSRIVVVVPAILPGCSPGGRASQTCSSALNGGPFGSFTGTSALIFVDANSRRDSLMAIIAHEAGHMLALDHAMSADYGALTLGPAGQRGVTNEYGDVQSNMGTGAGHMAAPHKALLGWLGDGAVQNVEAPGSFLLKPYEDSTAGAKALRIRRGGSSDAWLWLEYRQPYGFDQGLSNDSFSGALGHYEDLTTHVEDTRNVLDSGFTRLLDFNPTATPNTFADAPLKVGAKWSDPFSPLAIRVDSGSGSGLVVSVDYEASCGSLSISKRSHGTYAETGTITVSAPQSCTWSAASSADWITITSGQSGTGSGTVQYSLTPNTAPSTQGLRSAVISVARQSFVVTQAGPTCTLSPMSSLNVSVPPTVMFSDSLGVRADSASCDWSAKSTVEWIKPKWWRNAQNAGAVQYQVAANTSDLSRTGQLLVGNLTYTITQAAANCTFDLDPTRIIAASAGGDFTVAVRASQPGCPWMGAVPPIVGFGEVAYFPGAFTGSGSGVVNVRVRPNVNLEHRTGAVVVAGKTLTVVQAGIKTGSRFVQVTPCRVADTRNASGAFGGPFVPGGTSRDFNIPLSSCAIPTGASAYSLNVTVVPRGPLSFLTLYPAGAVRPTVSTLNSFDGRIKANAAIVPAGQNDAISVFATDGTDVIIDINGYFVSQSNAGSLSFYPLPPCRVADTRSLAGALGGPALQGGVARTLPILSSSCGVPAAAKAYSMNFTVVPQGALAYLTTWPAGATMPLVSTLNSLTGAVTANAAIVPAGLNGDISVFAPNKTELIVDVNGYFAPPGGQGALSFFTTVPCRLLDTRNQAGPFGGPTMSPGETRNYPIPFNTCDIPSTSKAYSLNATVVPRGYLGYLSMWPSEQSRPLVSTLNSFDASINSNAAIVPSGSSGSISAFVTDQTELILDISGYFAP